MKKKRFILMYISEISGHHSATIAIEKAMRKVNPDCEIMNINAFKYTNPISERIVNRIYLSVIRCTPGIWEYLYDNQNVVRKIQKMKSAVHKMNSPKFHELFSQFKPDLVLCTQAFPCGMVADFKKEFNNSVPLVAVLTDYVPHSYWLYDTVDYYITPSEEVSKRLMTKGVPKNKIKALGIPFDPGFCEPVSRESVLKKIGLSPEKPTVLVMGGGQGLGPIKTIVKSIDRVKAPDIQVIIVTGSNKKLYASLKKGMAKYKKKIALFGYTNMVKELMAASDLLITKPGGITTSEALAVNIPMLIIKPIPGQEESNTEYLTSQNAALRIQKPSKIHETIQDLLQNRDKLNRLRQAAKSISKPNSSIDIAKFLFQVVNA